MELAPLDPEKFIADFSRTVSEALASKNLEGFGAAGRKRAMELFAWDSIATRTLEVYKKALGS
jgi:starch synthase